MQEEFRVQNVKCGGCVQAIRDGLTGLSGVEAVEVVIEGGAVTVTGHELDRAALGRKLAEIGYPEGAGEGGAS